jgi:hypothetical protein
MENNSLETDLKEERRSMRNLNKKKREKYVPRVWRERMARRGAQKWK